MLFNWWIKSCGFPLNCAMASALKTPDDVHGGVGAQALELYLDILKRMGLGRAATAARLFAAPLRSAPPSRRYLR